MKIEWTTKNKFTAFIIGCFVIAGLFDYAKKKFTGTDAPAHKTEQVKDSK